MTTTVHLARVIEAIDFAAHAHRAQRRKDAELTPYINHPITLLRILGIEACIDDPDVLCAAALHDYIEDCCGGLGQMTVEQGKAIVSDRFGAQVLEYVMAVTDDKTLPKAERKRMQVEYAAHIPHSARLVKLADKTANLRDIAQCPPADWSVQRRREYFDWAATVVAQLRGTHAGLEALFAEAFAARP
ncbi:MAG: HD domain-containing protein [Lysobacter sp.]|nr:HD domain-containing protein [Lysobacter sp.]